jgi:hypothetical protein
MRSAGSRSIRVAALRDFITGWLCFSPPSADDADLGQGTFVPLGGAGVARPTISAMLSR